MTTIEITITFNERTLDVQFHDDIGDGEGYLLARLTIGNCPCHLELIEVDEEGDAHDTILRDTIDSLYNTGVYDKPAQDVEIDGRRYIPILTPHAR